MDPGPVPQHVMYREPGSLTAGGRRAAGGRCWAMRLRGRLLETVPSGPGRDRSVRGGRGGRPLAMRHGLSGGLQLLVCGLLVLALPASAGADGVVNLRGAYYKERSTRVQQPMVDAALDTGKRGRLAAHFLVDSITSASAATGAGGVEFNELRYEAGLGYSHELPGRVRLGVQGRYSTEPDYLSKFVAAHGEMALFDQTLTLRVLAGLGSDDITNGVAVMMGSLGTPRRQESLSTSLVSVGLTQVLAPRILATVTYDFARLTGYQANIYRVVRGGSEPVPERVPDLRLRHAVAGTLRAHLPSRTTTILSYRFYADDWGIVAHTPEARVVQELLPGLDARLRYRFFVQGAADFYKDVYMQAELQNPSVHVTDDEKLSRFETHTIGVQLSGAASLIGLRGGWGAMRVDVLVERILQTTSFGNAWGLQLGLSVPFEY
jgi:hypothetical protein